MSFGILSGAASATGIDATTPRRPATTTATADDTATTTTALTGNNDAPTIIKQSSTLSTIIDCKWQRPGSPCKVRAR